MRTNTIVSIAIVLLATSALPLAAQSRRAPDERLIQWMKSPQQRVRIATVEHMLKERSTTPNSPELDRLIAKELRDLNEAERIRMEKDRAGVKLPDDPNADYHPLVVELASRSSNPIMVPALVGALGHGTLVQQALAKHGDAAVPEVVAVARKRVGLVTGDSSPGDTPPPVVADALGTLKLLLEQTDRPLSASNRSLIATVASERLHGKQDGAVVVSALRLAGATKDAQLKWRVTNLVNDPAQLNAMGLDPQWRKMVDRSAKDALAKMK